MYHHCFLVYAICVCLVYIFSFFSPVDSLLWNVNNVVQGSISYTIYYLVHGVGRRWKQSTVNALGLLDGFAWRQLWCSGGDALTDIALSHAYFIIFFWKWIRRLADWRNASFQSYRRLLDFIANDSKLILEVHHALSVFVPNNEVVLEIKNCHSSGPLENIFIYTFSHSKIKIIWYACILIG